jgi:hypothetical protein
METLARVVWWLWVVYVMYACVRIWTEEDDTTQETT